MYCMIITIVQRSGENIQIFDTEDNKQAIIISFHFKIILIDPFLYQIPTYICHIDVSKMMINYTLK